MGSSTFSAADGCVGRGEELRRLASLADVAADRPVLVTGPWGAGKSMVLRALAESARSRGVHVVHASAARLPWGMPSPPLPPYADLRALLGQLSAPAPLPAPAGAAAGLSPLAAGMAAVRLLARAADASAAGVLAVIDDVHQVDEASARALAVVCRRLRSVRAGVVLASSERILPAALDVAAEEVVLGPLADLDAHRLLERHTALRRGRLRRTVVAQAQGNPLALIDYASTVAVGLAEEQAQWPGQRPLPCSPETMERLGAVLERLPAFSRLALLAVAAASGEELAAVLAADPGGLTPGVWHAAEEAGLVVTSAHGVKFTHPLIRSAVYHGAHPDERAIVHRGIAEALTGQPERRAWHLAEALAPGSRDPELAALLERGAGDTARRQGPEAAATALARAAALTDDAEDTARRLTQAAQQASLAGDTTWTRTLAVQALTLTQDPRVRDFALILAGSSLIWAGSYTEGLALQLPLVRANPARDASFASAALGAAAMAAYALGEEHYLAEVAAAAGQLAADHEVSLSTEPAVLLARTACAPFGDRDERTRQLRDLLSPGSRSDPRLAGAAALLLDESELAVEALGRYLDSLPGPAGRGMSGGTVATLAAACLATGRWSRAANLAGQLLATELLDQAEFSVVAAQTTLAFLAAQRGDTRGAARLAAAAERSAQQWSDRPALTRARHAAGLAALHAGRDEAAYEVLRGLLSDRSRRPLHFHSSYYVVADFALAAVRTGQHAKGSRILAGALRRLDGTPSPRVELLIRHARALLSAREDEAERHFRAALAPGGSQWPIEQASTTLHYAEWLRRRRRQKEAVPLLVSARRSFELVDAEPAVSRANEELRAARRSGAAPDRTGRDLAAAARAWSEMSAHQQRILRLAAQGRSNGEIAAELSLSPRTVGSHLYRAFPALGISSRYQVRDVLADLDTLLARGADQ